MKLSPKAQQTALLIGAGALALWWFSGRAKAVAKAVNPVSRENIFYRGVNAVGDVIDDGGSNDSFSLGASIYDLFHDDPEF